MELIKVWEDWAKKNGYTSLTQDGIIKTMMSEFCKHLESIPMQAGVGVPKPRTESENISFIVRVLQDENFDDVNTTDRMRIEKKFIKDLYGKIKIDYDSYYEASITAKKFWLREYLSGKRG